MLGRIASILTLTLLPGIIPVARATQHKPFPPRLADLVVSTHCRSGYSETRGRTKALVIVVENIGYATAAPATTLIRIPRLNLEREVRTRPLRPGSKIEIPVAIPPECWDSGCSFMAVADSENLIPEISERNNAVRGRIDCGR